jgi:capsular polysaccharide biosynthesis protein
MDIIHYFSIFFRRITEIIGIALAIAIISILYSLFFVNTNFISTNIVTIASKRPEKIDFRDYTVYETLRGADTFSETVQGWTKSTNFYQRIEKDSGVTGFNLSTRAQEKQNILVEIKADSKEKVQKATDAFINVLKSDLEEYNTKTNSTFVVAWDSAFIAEDIKNIKFIFLVSLLTGLILAILFFYLLEFLFGVCSYVFQAEKVLKVKALETIKLNFKDKDTEFLKSYLNNLNEEYVIAGTGFKSNEFCRRMGDLANKKFIDEILQNIESLKAKTLILFVKLGVTKLQDLKKLKLVYNGNVLLVLVK